MRYHLLAWQLQSTNQYFCVPSMSMQRRNMKILRLLKRRNWRTSLVSRQLLKVWRAHSRKSMPKQSVMHSKKKGRTSGSPQSRSLQKNFKLRFPKPSKNAKQHMIWKQTPMTSRKCWTSWSKWWESNPKTSDFWWLKICFTSVWSISVENCKYINLISNITLEPRIMKNSNNGWKNLFSPMSHILLFERICCLQSKLHAYATRKKTAKSYWNCLPNKHCKKVHA